jgi:hypothetical protein
MSTESNGNATSKFEIAVAILLGLAAIGTAWASYQSSLWGGNQATAYNDSAIIATNAATMKTEAFVDIASDFAIDIQAKKLIAESRRNRNPVNLEMASYLYLFQMSDPGFKALGFPAEYAFQDTGETPATPAASTTAPAAATDSDDDDATEAPAASSTPRLGADALPQIPADLLIASLENDLDDDEGYYQAHLGEGIAEEQKARARFLEGQEFNKTGDKYSLVGVILTIALFFAGISLVFKSEVRWKLFYMGGVVFVVGLLYMLTLPLA